MEWAFGKCAKDIDWVAPVPEPSTMLLLSGGFVVLVGAAIRKLKK